MRMSETKHAAQLVSVTQTHANTATCTRVCFCPFTYHKSIEAWSVVVKRMPALQHNVVDELWAALHRMLKRRGGGEGRWSNHKEEEEEEEKEEEDGECLSKQCLSHALRVSPDTDTQRSFQHSQAAGPCDAGDSGAPQSYWQPCDPTHTHARKKGKQRTTKGGSSRDKAVGRKRQTEGSRGREVERERDRGVETDRDREGREVERGRERSREKRSRGREVERERERESIEECNEAEPHSPSIAFIRIFTHGPDLEHNHSKRPHVAVQEIAVLVQNLQRLPPRQKHAARPGPLGWKRGTCVCEGGGESRRKKIHEGERKRVSTLLWVCLTSHIPNVCLPVYLSCTRTHTHARTLHHQHHSLFKDIRGTVEAARKSKLCNL